MNRLFHLGYVRTQLASGRAILLLDAWDEVSDLDGRRKLAEDICNCHHATRILLTSRIVGYDMTPPPLRKGVEVELLAWEWRQIESFVQIWFGVHSQESKRFVEKLRQHPQFRGLARIPLMLMLLCRAYPNGEFPARRSDVYERCLRGLLREWHIQDKGRYSELQLSDTYIEAMIDVLAELSLTLYEQGRQQFKESDLRPALDSFLCDLARDRPLHEFVHEKVDPSRLVKRFKDDGVLIATTVGGQELRFLHLTIYEYLVTRALAKRSDCIEKALAHMYDPAWNQILVMLGGILKGLGPYMAALLRENRADVLCRPLFLAIHASGEATGNQHLKDCCSRIADEMLSISVSGKNDFLRDIAQQAIEYLPQAIGYLFTLARRTRSVAVSAIHLLGRIGSEESVRALCELLHNENDRYRTLVVQALGNTGSEEAVPALIEKLQDASRAVRLMAAEALGRIGSEKAIPVLIEALRNADGTLRVIARWALGEIGSEQAVPALLGLLRDEDGVARCAAVQTLGDIGSEQVVPALLELLRDDDKRVRCAAVQALGSIGSADAVPALLGLLRDEDVAIRYAAVRALGSIGSADAVPALCERLREKDEFDRAFAVQVLGDIGSAEAATVLWALVRNKDEVHRVCAVKTLDKVESEQAVPALLELLRDEDKRVRCAAVRALGSIGSADAVPALCELLRNKDEVHRVCAVKTLDKVESEQAVPALLALWRDEDKILRYAAVRALGSIGSADAVPALLGLLRDEDVGIRRDAVQTLGSIGSADAVPALCELLRNKDEFDRAFAANALGDIGSAETVPALIEKLQDASTAVRLMAAEGLRRIRSGQAISIHSQVPEDEERLSTLQARVALRDRLQSLSASLDRLADLCENPKK